MEVTHMNRKHLLAIAIAGIVALGAGCAQHDPTPLAGATAAVTEPSVGPDGLPLVVITAPRTGPHRIVLSERDPGSNKD
jgi:hypothetical protein